MLFCWCGFGFCCGFFQGDDGLPGPIGPKGIRVSIGTEIMGKARYEMGSSQKW